MLACGVWVVLSIHLHQGLARQAMHLSFSSRHDGGDDMLCPSNIPRSGTGNLNFLFNESRMKCFIFTVLKFWLISDLFVPGMSSCTSKNLLVKRCP